MRTLLRQPILHFLALASLLFVAHDQLNPSGGVSNSRIIVDDKVLKEYIQYQARNFSEGFLQDRWRTMSPEEKRKLADDLVRDEVLYREAVAMQLDKDDYVIKQRMIQKMQYLVHGFEGEERAPDADSIEAFYLGNPERYREPATATFTHIFLSGESRSEEQLQTAATTQLQQLNQHRIPVTEAPSLGNRFIYHVNYVERSEELVASHFGDDFANRLFALEPDAARWQGPLPSRYGLHLVLLSGKNAGGVPPLPAIYDRVAADTRQWQADQRSEQAVTELMGRYDIELEISGENGVLPNAIPSADSVRVSQR